MESLRILFFRLTECGLGLDRDLNAIISIGVAGCPDDSTSWAG